LIFTRDWRRGDRSAQSRRSRSRIRGKPRRSRKAHSRKSCAAQNRIRSAGDFHRRITSPRQAFESHAPPFDFIFLDPPYAAEHEYELALDFLAGSSLISTDSIVIAEHRKMFALAETFGLLQRYRVLKQGDAALSFYRLNPHEK